MKKILILMSFVVILFSCKENEINGFDSASVKKEIVDKLGESEWVANNSKAYYSKIAFDKDIIVLTKDGGQQRVGFDVTNVSAPSPTLPDTIQLRLKSGLFLDEIYLSNSLNGLRSVYRSNLASDFTGDYDYKRVK